MTNTSANAYALAIDARINEETAKLADKAAIKFLTDCKRTVSVEKIAKMLEKASVNIDFAHDSRIENKKMCMKAIQSFDHLISFAATESFTVNSLKSNLEECLRTLVNFGSAKRNVTLQDFDDCLNASAKIDKERKSLIVQRKTQFGAHKRHAEMSMRAMHAANLLVSVNKREYRVNTENEIFKALEKRFAA